MCCILWEAVTMAWNVGGNRVIGQQRGGWGQGCSRTGPMVAAGDRSRARVLGKRDKGGDPGRVGTARELPGTGLDLTGQVMTEGMVGRAQSVDRASRLNLAPQHPQGAFLFPTLAEITRRFLTPSEEHHSRMMVDRGFLPV